MENQISIWTVYDHPTDYPESFVARRFCGIKATRDRIVVKDLEAIRKTMRALGLRCLARFPEDDPKIIETWI